MSSATQAGIERIRREREVRVVRIAAPQQEPLTDQAERAGDAAGSEDRWPRIIFTEPFHKRLIRAIARFHGYEASDLTGPGRFKELVLARRHAIYEVIRLCPKLSANRISDIFGRDHTTILYSASAFHEDARAIGIKLPPILRDDISAAKDADFYHRHHQRGLRLAARKRAVKQ